MGTQAEAWEGGVVKGGEGEEALGVGLEEGMGGVWVVEVREEEA